MAMAMAMTLRSELSRSVAILFGLLILGAAAGTTEASLTTPAMYVFGDSNVDTGTNDFISNPLAPRANFDPYGESFIPRTGRFSNGRLIPDILCQDLVLPYTVPYLKLNLFPNNPARFVGQSINFASAGSGVLPTTFAFQGVDNLDTQMAQFQNVLANLNPTNTPVGKAAADKFIRNIVVLMYFAGNDLL